MFNFGMIFMMYDINHTVFRFIVDVFVQLSDEQGIHFIMMSNLTRLQ